MKRMLIALFIALLLPTAASAKNSLYAEELNHITADKLEPHFQLFAPYKLTKYVGLYSWVSAHWDWAEIVNGLILSPTPAIELGVAGGVESADNLWRINTFLWMGNEKGYVLGMWESGASGFSYNLEGSCQVLSWLGAGFFAKSKMGFGPRVQFNIPKKNVMLYVAPLYNSESKNFGGVVGFRFGP